MEEKNYLYKEEQMNGASREYRHDEGTGLIQGTEKAQQKLKKKQWQKCNKIQMGADQQDLVDSY